MGMDQLPEDVVTGILSRLARRCLARSRVVCREWRATVDARRLLRTDGLPLSVGGIFVNVRGPAPAEFLARPSKGPNRISGRIQDYVQPLPIPMCPYVEGCCNGLLLVDNNVVNPATRQWARLPPCPPIHGELEGFDDYKECLVFDPAAAVSSPPHYEVFLVPYVYIDVNLVEEGSQWPPSPCVIQVFSSRTTRWEEERLFDEDNNKRDAMDANSEWDSDNDSIRDIIDCDEKLDFGSVASIFGLDEDDNKRDAMDENLEWDSDNDNFRDITDCDEKLDFGSIASIFGFHPFREVIFLRMWNDRIVAYHFNTLKVQELGEFEVEYAGRVIAEAFVYTPFWKRELFDGMD
ncbi:hypothetical protein QOZ80_3BG0266550 [Eleusine coracana subsp. coracana]|nr:hypothetical protein QOZ80_3BG0266550 [Eleusine coracana subsp. coracana]